MAGKLLCRCVPATWRCHCHTAKTTLRRKRSLCWTAHT